MAHFLIDRVKKMLIRNSSAILGLTIVLAACGGGGTQTVVTLDSVLTGADAGLYEMVSNGTNIRYFRSDALSEFTYDYDRNTKVFAENPAGSAYTRWVLNKLGVWESKAWVFPQDLVPTKQLDGKYLSSTWNGGQDEVSVTSSVDVTGKPIAQYLPFLAMLQTNMSIKDGAVFGAGSKLINVSRSQISDNYMLHEYVELSSATLDDWLSAADAGTTLNGDTVNLDGVTSSAISGAYSLVHSGVTYAGTWEKRTIGESTVVVLLGGSKTNQYFWQNTVGCHPLIGAVLGNIHTGIYCQAGTKLMPEKTYAAASFNKAAWTSIAANLEPGTFYGYGTATTQPEVTSLLVSGVNYVYLDNVNNLQLDRNILMGDGFWKNNNRFGLNLATLTFDYDANIPNSGPGATTILNSSGVWQSVSVYSTASVQSDASLLQTANSWNGGQMSSTYSTIDLSGTPISETVGILPNNGFNGGYVPQGKVFGSGAKFISHRFIQKTTGYQLWTWSTGCSSLDALVNDTSVDMWTGMSVKFVFPAISGGATSGKVSVQSPDGSIVYGQADWTKKQVQNVEVVVVTNVPVAATSGDNLNKQNPIFSLYGGEVYRGMEVLAGRVIDTSASVVLNNQAAAELAASIWKY